MKKFMRQSHDLFAQYRLVLVVLALVLSWGTAALQAQPVHEPAGETVIPKKPINSAKVGALHARRNVPKITIRKAPHKGASRYEEKIRPDNTLTPAIHQEHQQRRQAHALAHRNKQAAIKQAMNKRAMRKAAQKQRSARVLVQVAGDDVEEVDAPKDSEPSLLLHALPAELDPTLQQVINIPAGFTDAGEKTGSISVGSRNGALEAWCVAPGGTHLLRYNDNKTAENPETHAADQWEAITVQDTHGTIINRIRSVAISSDGELLILDAPGQAYRYNWDKKQFVVIPVGHARRFDKKTKTVIKYLTKRLGLDYIAVGNEDNIWAANLETRMIYKLDTHTNTWKPMVDGIYVSVGLDGFVVAIDDNYIPHVYGGKNAWYAMAGIKLDHVAVGTQNYIYGTYQGNLYRHNNNGWVQLLGADDKPAHGVLNVAVNAVGTIFITSHGEIYHKGDDGVLAEKVGTKLKIQKAPHIKKSGVQKEKAQEKAQEKENVKVETKARTKARAKTGTKAGAQAQAKVATKKAAQAAATKDALKR